MNQVLLSLKDTYVKNKNDIIRTFLISEGFGFCVSLSCVWGYELDHKNTVCGSVGQVMGIILTSLFFSVLVALVLTVSVCLVRQRREHVGRPFLEPRKKNQRFIQWGIVSAILLVCWIPIYLAYFPAVFSYDAEAQLYQVISGNYSTHHPLIHTLMMGLFMKIGYSPAGINTGMALYAAFQMIVFAALLGLGLTSPWKVRRPISDRALVVLITFFALFPVFGILAVSTTKDVIFAGCVVGMTVMMCNHYDHKSWYIGLGIITFLALIFRNNAGYALILELVIISLWGYTKSENSVGKVVKTRPWKMLMTLAGAWIVSMVVLFGLKTVTGAESGSPREALSIPIQQMARVKVLHNDELDAGIKADLNVLIDDEWADRYDEHLADPIKERISMKQPGLFVKTWLKLGTKYPGTYLDAWLLTTEGAWYLRDTSCNRIYGEGQLTGFGYLSTDIRHMPEGFEVKEASVIPPLRSFLEKIVSDNAFEKVPLIRLLFAPAFYFWLTVVYVYVRIINKDKAGLRPVIFLMAYFLTLLLSPAILVRYMLPFMLTAPILLVYRYDYT